jgi:hypothetical protein
VTHATLKINPEAATTSGKDSVRVEGAMAESNMQPPFMVPREELFFWTRQWQAGERESAEERRRGNTRTFGSAAAFLAWLDSDDED